MTLKSESVRVWRDGWWRLDGGAWVHVETAFSGAQWAAPTRGALPSALSSAGGELAALVAEALTLSSGAPIAVLAASGDVYLATREWGKACVRRLVGNSGPGALVSLPPPPLVVVLRAHPLGPEGVQESIARVKDAIERGRNNPYLVTWARQRLHEAGLDGPRGNPSPDQIVRVLFEAQKRELSFVKDPVNGELMANPETLLCLDPNGPCMPAGDCDDQLIVAGSAVASVGIPVHLVIRKYPRQVSAHITLEYDSAPRLGGPWKCLDPSTDSGVCSAHPYLEQTIVDVIPDSQQTFVGLGDPAAAYPAGGELGQPPAPAPELPPEQAAGWLARLERVQYSLSQSTERLRTNSAALSAVRADLGLPALDVSSAGETVGGGSPLLSYIQTGAWTAEAQRAESALLQTADFVSSCIADGLAGTRGLYFSNGDILIEAKPGDPYRIAMAPGPSGGLVPTYFDAQGVAVGTLGLAPILIGAIVAAVSLAVAYVVGKICDSVATSHHDDALNKIASEQASLVQSGAATPAQAAAMTKAFTDLDRTEPAKPGALQEFLNAFPVVAILGAAAAGVAGGFGLSRLWGSLFAVPGRRRAEV